MNNNENLISVAQLARAADVTTQTAYRWTDPDGDLHDAVVIVVGRRLVRRAAAEKFIAKRANAS